MDLKVKLIPEWKEAWKYASVRFQAAGIFVMAVAQFMGEAWNGLPAGLQQKLPHASTIALILFGLGLIGRVLIKTDAAESADAAGAKTDGVQ